MDKKPPKMGEEEEDDMYGHKALLSTIVEEMEERLSEEDMMSSL